MDDGRHILSPPTFTQIEDLSHALQAWENLEQDSRNALKASYTETCDLLFLCMCPTDLEGELTAQHLFPDIPQMRGHTYCDSHTGDPAPMMMANLNEEDSNLDATSDEFLEGEDGELHWLGNIWTRGSSPKLGMIWAKGILLVKGRAKPTKNVFVACVDQFFLTRANGQPWLDAPFGPHVAPAPAITDFASLLEPPVPVVQVVQVPQVQIIERIVKTPDIRSVERSQTLGSLRLATICQMKLAETMELVAGRTFVNGQLVAGSLFGVATL